MEGLSKGIGEEFAEQHRHGRELLEGIAAITSPEFAERAAGALDHRKHLYGYEAYLTVLGNLKTLLLYGMPEGAALEGAQSGYAPERVAEAYRLYRECPRGK